MERRTIEKSEDREAAVGSKVQNLEDEMEDENGEKTLGEVWTVVWTGEQSMRFTATGFYALLLGTDNNNDYISLTTTTKLKFS